MRESGGSGGRVSSKYWAARIAAVVTLACATPAAHTVSLVFDAVPAQPSSICPAPCLQVRIFLQDPTRVLEIQEIEIEMLVDSTVLVSGAFDPLPVGNASNGAFFDALGNVRFLPWDRRGGTSEIYDNLVLVVNSASAPFSIDSFSTQRAGLTCRSPGYACSAIAIADPRDRLHLGFFPVTVSSESQTIASLQVMRLTGSGEVIPLLEKSLAMQSRFEVALPEASSQTLLALVLVTSAMTLARTTKR